MKLHFLFTLFCLSLAFTVSAQSLSNEELMHLIDKANTLKEQQQYDEAIAILTSVGKETEQQRDNVEKEFYLTSQISLGLCYYATKQFEQGYKLNKKLIQLKLSNDYYRLVSEQLVNHGYNYAFQHLDVNGGNENYTLMREIMEDIFPYANENDKKVIENRIYTLAYFEGIENLGQHDFINASLCYEKALKGFRKLNDPKNELSVISALAGAKQYLFEIDSALTLNYQALELSKQLNNQNKQVDILWKLYKIYDTFGDVTKTSQYLSSLDSIAEQTNDNSVLFTYYIEKGKIYQNNNETKQAELCFLKAEQLINSLPEISRNSNQYIVSTNLYDHYVSTKQYDKAKHYGQTKLCAAKAVYTQNDFGYYEAYTTMTHFYKETKNKEMCFAYLDSLSLYESKTLSPDILSFIYQEHAIAHYSFEEYTSALNYYNKADSILSTKYPVTNKKRLQLLPLIGGTKHKLNHHLESENYYRQYAQEILKMYGQNSLEYIRTLIYLANAEGFANHIDEGCKDYTQATALLKNLIKEKLPYLDSSDRQGLWQSVSSLFTNMTPYALEAKLYQTSFTQSCYNSLIMTKGFLLSSERSVYNTIKEYGNDDDTRDYMSLSMLRKHIKDLSKNYVTFSDSILKLSQRANILERQLSQKISHYANTTDFIDVDYNSLKQHLGQNDVIIDFTDYISKSKGRKYAAYLIKHSQTNPLLIPLFEERQIDSLNITSPNLYYDAEISPDVLKLLWNPLTKHIKEGSTIYYIPSQLYFQISLESLPLTDGTLLGDHYNFIRLSSARELTNIKKKIILPKNPTATLFGGLKYNMDASTMLAKAKEHPTPTLYATRGNTINGDLGFEELPYTKQEIISIDSILKSHHWQTSVKTDTDGTEESFVCMHKCSPQILHIATHGFYYTPKNAENVEFLKGHSEAMTLSGIILSGANLAWSGKPLPEGVHGGVLTAYNISQLDLSNTELVVLSTCQSGQGEATSEGLYGLQRAFKKAGVSTIIMTLWKVDDNATKDFMITFYKQLANTNWNTRLAFKQTKDIIRKTDKYNDPYYWAAFIMLD